MASSKIKGITIEINGNTTKLQEALKGVDKQVYSLNGDLKALNQALKLDPKNTELLAQKQEVLARNIQASKDRLETLKEAQRQMGDYSKLTDEQKESYNQLSLEIAKAENALKSMNEELKNSGKHDFTALKEGLKKVGDVALEVSKKVLQIGAAIGGALAGVVVAGVKSYAELEKAQKGSERLFGDAFKTVKKNAADAYKSMGLSASQYYDQVNTYAVGLKNALKGDTQKAAELANSILVAQADIVASTGANVDTVQNAFSAVMRGNYTMLDNLRLGIKGSKQGMQEVIDKVNQWNKANGNATHYQMGNYADMQQALVDYVKMVGVAGTAQKQMSETISGSLSQLKAAWTNFLSGVGKASDVSKTLKTFLKNVFNVIKQLAPELINGIVELVSDLIPELVSMAGELMPVIIKGVQKLIEGVIDFIKKDNGQFIKMAVSVITSFVKFLIENLPLIIDAGLKLIVALAEGIAESLPELVPTIIDCVLQIVDTLINNIDLIIDAGFKLLMGLVQGIINAIPKLIEKIPEIVSKMATKFKEGVWKLVEAGKELFAGLWRGVEAKYNEYIAGGGIIPNFTQRLVQKIKDLFGIHSPSKIMRDQIGKNLGLGIVEGINDTVVDVENAMSNLSSRVEASVNPTINPTANSNPLYITIDKFYNNRETDIQRLAEELEFYRKNNALAKGGV